MFTMDPRAKCERHGHSFYYTGGPCPGCRDEHYAEVRRERADRITAIQAAIVAANPKISPEKAAKLAIEHADAMEKTKQDAENKPTRVGARRKKTSR